jgi:hypothetical protein
VCGGPLPSTTIYHSSLSSSPLLILLKIYYIIYIENEKEKKSMLTKKEIIDYIIDGHDIDELYNQFDELVAKAQDEVVKLKAAELEKQAKEKTIAEAREKAVAALTDYVALVNPDIKPEFINAAVEVLKTVKVRNGKINLYDIMPVLF